MWLGESRQQFPILASLVVLIFGKYDRDAIAETQVRTGENSSPQKEIRSDRVDIV